MSGTMKITKARLEMLAQIARDPGPYSISYKPVRALREAGLVSRSADGRFEVTEAGKGVLRDADRWTD